MSGDLENLTDRDFSIIESWGLKNNPFAAIKDYSPLKTELRWMANGQFETYKEYVRKRNEYIKSEDFDNLYFAGAGTHPGAGIPSVVTSAEVMAKLIPDASYIRLNS